MKLLRLLPAVALLLASAHAASAQSSCLPNQISVEGPPFFEAWVDVSQGNDGSAVVSTPTGTTTVAQAKAAPFKTIQSAIDAVFSLVALPSNPGIVHLQPGIYDPTTQTFPVFMQNGVNVQGVSARECILRKGAAHLGQDQVFVPDSQGFCGTHVTAKVLVDFSTSISIGGFPFSEMIDGVTFQGSHVQVYAAASPSMIAGRVSNCLFDMVDYGPALRGPEFGLLTVHDWDPLLAGYQQINMDIFNNTFVMGWLPNGYGGVVFNSSSTAVGICDVNNPQCGKPNPVDRDPDPSLRNIGLSNIQNNLFRELEFGLSTAFLGVPFEDTSDSNAEATNIFLNALVTTSAYQVWIRTGSSLLAESAVPYDDPAHVGEMMTNFLGLNFVNVGRDWRVLPDSLVVDAGIAPTNGILAAFNGQVYTEPSVLNGSCQFSAIDSFDFDGEGYGNRRVVGAQVDVGFDEFELLIDSGLGNESLAIPAGSNPCSGVTGDPCYCVPFPGAGIHRLIVKGGGQLALRIKSASCPATAYTIQPGSALPPSSVGSSFLWFNAPFLLTAPLTPTLHTNYVPPDSTVAHKFGIVTRSSVNNGAFRLFQGQYGGVWSNLQATFD